MTHRFGFALIAALTLGLTTPLHASDRDIADSIADSSRSAENRALDEGRNPVAILGFADFQSGDVVADFMAGNGYYSELIADIVGKKGRVYAINLAGFHNKEKWAALLAHYRNVSVMPVPPKAMLLAPGSVDAIFAHLTFHDLYWESEKYKIPRLDVDYILHNWFTAVKSGGQVVVVDHVGPAGDPREVVERLHRINPTEVVKAMTTAGFVLEGRNDALHVEGDDLEKNVFDPSVRGKTDRFALKFRKPE